MKAETMHHGRRPFLQKILALGGLLALPAGQAQQSRTQAGSDNLPSPTGIIFGGIRGRVVAFDRTSGNVVWSTHLNGGDFVNLVFAGRDLYASTQGELFCVDAGTGQIRWHNRLKGYGRGLMTIATSETPGNQAAVFQAKRHQEEEQAAAQYPPA